MDGVGDREGVAAGVYETTRSALRVEGEVVAVRHRAPFFFVGVEPSGPVGRHGGLALPETRGDLVVVPLRRLLGRGSVVEIKQHAQCPAARLVVQAWRGGTLAFEHPSPSHRVQLEEVAEEAGLFAGEDEPVRLLGPYTRGLLQQFLPGGGWFGKKVRAVEEQLHVQVARDAVEFAVDARQLE